MKAPKRRWVKTAFQLLGIALFVLILSRVDLAETARAYRNFEPIHIAYAVSIMLVFILVKSIRWKRIVKMQEVDVPLTRAFRVYASALYLGVITPGRLGDFAKSLYLINSGMEAGKAIFSSLLDRLLDIIFLVVIGYASLLFFRGIFANQLVTSSLLLGIVVLIAVAVFWRRDLLMSLTKGFIRSAVPARFRTSLSRVAAGTFNEFGLLRSGRIFEIVLFTIAAWVLHYGFFFLTAKVLELEMSVPILVASISAAVFTSLLPVSFLGLGTRDAVLIVIFSRIGLSREAAVSFSFAFVIVYLIIGLLGLSCWLTAPFHRERGVSDSGKKGE